MGKHTLLLEVPKRTVYTPHTKQKLFHADKHRHRLFVCGYSTGKTASAVIEAFIQATIIHPGKRGALAAPTETMLRNTLVTAWKKWIPSELYTLKIRDKKILLTNGSEILLYSTAHVSAAEGVNLGWFVMDECFRETRPEAFQVLESRLRDGYPGRECRGIYIGSPQGPSHYLLSKFGTGPDGIKFHGSKDHWWTGNRATIRASTMDNPHVDKKALADWLKNDPLWIQQYIHAEFVTREGMVFDQFNPTKHIINHAAIPPIKDYFLGADYGQSSPGSLMVIGRDFKNNLYVVEEHYHDRVVYRHDEGWGLIFEAARKKYRPQWCAFDSASPGPMADMVKATNKQLPIYPSLKDNIAAINLIQNSFSRGTLFVSNRCTNLIREVQSLSYKMDRQGKSTEDISAHAENHAIDGLKYALMRLDLQTKHGQ